MYLLTSVIAGVLFYFVVFYFISLFFILLGKYLNTLRTKSVKSTLNVSDENNKLRIVTMFVTANTQTFHTHILRFIISQRYSVRKSSNLKKNKSIAIYLFANQVALYITYVSYRMYNER
jgi:hypothetical protein